jgi:hypothetical protein
MNREGIKKSIHLLGAYSHVACRFPLRFLEDSIIHCLVERNISHSVLLDMLPSTYTYVVVMVGMVVVVGMMVVVVVVVVVMMVVGMVIVVVGMVVAVDFKKRRKIIERLYLIMILK